MAAHDAQLLEHLPKAEAEAARLWWRVRHFVAGAFDREDLIQEARGALFRASRRWSEVVEANLWTFARRSVRKALFRFLHNSLRHQAIPFEAEGEETPPIEDMIDVRRVAFPRLRCGEPPSDVAARLGLTTEERGPWTVPELARAVRLTDRRIRAIIARGNLFADKQLKAQGGFEWLIPDWAAQDFLMRRKSH